MCTVMTALGLTAGAYSSYAQGEAAKAQADAQANALEQNAKISEYQAHDAIQRGGQDELRLRRSLAIQQGQARAAMGASGIDIDSGSMRDVIHQSIQEGEHDAEAIRFNAARERWGYLQQANNMRAQAQTARNVGSNAYRNALFGGVLKLGAGVADYYSDNDAGSPLTQYNDDRSKYWGPVYNPIQARKRGYISEEEMRKGWTIR